MIPFWQRVNTGIKGIRETQASFAQKTGIKFKTLKNWLSTDVLPRADDAVRIAGELSVTVEYLVDGVMSTVPREIESFYMQYKKFSVLLEYLIMLTQEQREDIEALALTLVEKKQALEARKSANSA